MVDKPHYYISVLCNGMWVVFYMLCDSSHTNNEEVIMNIEEVIKALKHHQKWRKGANIEMLHPKYLGEVIDEAIKLLEEYEHRESK